MADGPAMTRTRLALLVSLAMLAFAGNSLLCRLALKHTRIDAASFTTVRLVSGALMLWLLARSQRSTNTSTTDRIPGDGGNWLSALALFIYAAGFSFAYVSMTAATGALILFGAVQASMVTLGLFAGERLRALQIVGFVLALGGLVALMLPGLATPSLTSGLCMLAAGVSWGVYTLRGKRNQSGGAGNPVRVTAGNFLRAAPMAVVLSLVTLNHQSLDAAGIGFAVVSGALASGVGYAIWYQALPALRATHAATIQLSVPVIAALGGVAFIGETISAPMLLASGAILGGIALVILDKK